MKTLYAIVDNSRLTYDPIHHQLRIFPEKDKAEDVLRGLQNNGTIQQRCRRAEYKVVPVEVSIEQVVTTRTELAVFTPTKSAETVRVGGLLASPYGTNGITGDVPAAPTLAVTTDHDGDVASTVQFEDRTVDIAFIRNGELNMYTIYGDDKEALSPYFHFNSEREVQTR
jgi:hypothetical protein